MYMTPSNRVITLAGAALLMICAGLPVHADDTEIFVATPPTSVNTRPNILFIMDTSGSMATEVVDKATYSAATSYAGSCSSDRVYWNSSGSDDPPECNTDRWINATSFRCKTAADKLATFGSWPIGPAAQWRTSNKGNRWDRLSDNRHTEDVECQADAAIGHGLVDNDNKYPRDGSSGPYTTNSSEGIAWTGDTNRSYVFYSGNYLNWFHNAPSTELGTRLSIVQQSAKDTLDRLTNVNVGLMRFSSDADGGMVLYPLSPIESARDALKAEIDAFDPNGGTPLSETFLEAYRYWSGGNVRFGLDSVTGPSGSRVLKPSVDSSRTGSGLSQYLSPLGSACQKNFVVYLTDGDPTVDQAAEAEIELLPNFSTLGNVTTEPTNGGQCSENGALGTEGGGAVAGDGKCLDDLAKYMLEKDFFDDSTLPPDRDPKENIRTYTIGFGDGVSERGLALLKATAAAGGGEFYEAGDTATLTEAFNSIIRSVLEDNVSFTAPAVSVNAFNRTQNLNDLFVTVFKPDDSYHWPGNLKKYRLDPDDGSIRDADGDPAVDESDGFFRDDARSYWSAAADGADVEDGGAANELPDPAARRLFTDIAAVDGTTNDLTDPRNAVADANSPITSDTLGMPAAATASERTALIDWARGLNATSSTARLEMGDPLHARPVSLIYGGTAANPDAVVFVATNDGYLHAIDPDDGSELWAFVPSELLGRIYNLRENAGSAVKRYGLDGNLVSHRIDRDEDGVIEAGDGDKMYLFFGMGRGGDNYYALDVTDKSSPRFLWRNGADFTMSGLGQSWSTPVITKVLVGSGSSQNADRLVMIVGGGYDPTQDAVPYNTDDTGNSLFMLDAISGDVLWRGSSSGADFNDSRMNNSIPADVRVLDMTNDGFADRMYVADTGGRIWRFDIYNAQSGSSLVRGAVFASLGAAAGSGGTSPADARRFYVAPDASLLRADDRFYLNIAIGSGYRGHPLSTEIHEAFYSLRDPRPFLPMNATEYSSLVPITHTDSGLIDVTTNIDAAIPTGAKGWKIELSQPSWSGEKVLAEARTFNGAILFPTFAPVGNTATQTCTAQSGTNALYIVNAANGRPVLNRDGDATLEAEDRSGRLDQHGIAPPVAVFFPTPDPGCTGEACTPPPVCLVGVEHCGISFSNDPVKTFWTNQDTDSN
jgi:type IV pilus assembly protein PilY1